MDKYNKEYKNYELNNELLKKMMILSAFQMKNEDLILNMSNDLENIDFNSENEVDFEENTSFERNKAEKFDEEQLFFDQKRERIKKKIEEAAPKNMKTKEKNEFKNNNFQKKTINFIERNSNFGFNKHKTKTKRLNGMSVRINHNNN